MAARSLAGNTILLIEDEFLVALEVADALKAAGAKVLGPFATLEAARDAASNTDADLAILDIDLRGEEVFPAAHVLRQRGIPFMFYTGRPDRDALRNDFADVPVCAKPIQTNRLLDELRKLLPMAA